ncbi:hypothetical protein AURDEDRAFT_126730 [Auricularia subglabra TFB-10046 SS5]|nr:hypothetical protein AURDEDRAFT_126730 [Auricularia subglabra TFB-10046 SS5]
MHGETKRESGRSANTNTGLCNPHPGRRDRAQNEPRAGPGRQWLLEGARLALEASRPKPPPVEVAVQTHPPKKQRRAFGVQTDPVPVRVDLGVQTNPPPAYLSLDTQIVAPPAASAGVQTDLRVGREDCRRRGEAAVRDEWRAGLAAVRQRVSAELQVVPPGYTSSHAQADGADNWLMAVDGHDEHDDDMIISPSSAPPDWKRLHARVLCPSPYSFAGFIPASARAKYKLGPSAKITPQSGSKYDGLIEMWAVRQLDSPLAHPPPSHVTFQQHMRAQLGGKYLELALTAAPRWFWAREEMPRLARWEDTKDPKGAISWGRKQALAEADFNYAADKGSNEAKIERPPLAELPRTQCTLKLNPAFARDKAASGAKARVLLRLDEAERRLVAYGENFDECRMLEALRDDEYVSGRRALHVRAWGALRLPGYTYAEMKAGDGSSKRDTEPPMGIVFFKPASLDVDAPKRAGYPAPDSDVHKAMLEQWTWDLPAPSPSHALTTIEKLQDRDLVTASNVLAAFVAVQLSPAHPPVDDLDRRDTLQTQSRQPVMRVLAEMTRERIAGFVPSSFPGPTATRARLSERSSCRATSRASGVPALIRMSCLAAVLMLETVLVLDDQDPRAWFKWQPDEGDAAVACAAFEVVRVDGDGASWVETKASHAKRQAEERAAEEKRAAEESARKDAEAAAEKTRREQALAAKARKEQEALDGKARKEQAVLAEKAPEAANASPAVPATKAAGSVTAGTSAGDAAAPLLAKPSFVPIAFRPSAPSTAKPKPLKAVASTASSRAPTAASLFPTSAKTKVPGFASASTNTPRSPSPSKAPLPPTASKAPPPPPQLPKKPATAVPGFVAASAPERELLRIGDLRTTTTTRPSVPRSLPRGDNVLQGADYDRALEGKWATSKTWTWDV